MKTIPEPLQKPIYDELEDACKDYIRHFAENDKLGENTMRVIRGVGYNIFEEALCAVYGPTIFDWISEQI
jgi:hypothetical protein